ncbi:putative membrane protein [Sorangium cellulosum So ce56]|uniref:Membrane protein n=1 Tax=Sorangium cellulosum (strain So ce56) TaxID=448385 RepID=A9G368_SORC5|nr:putative membrane protein [Sorangium cellulosum So ce56]
MRSSPRFGKRCPALVQSFLADNPRWDSRSTWLDGLFLSRCDVHDGVLHVAGGVFLIISGATFIAPLAASLRADETGLTALAIRFGDATAGPIPYDGRFSWHKLAFPDDGYYRALSLMRQRIASSMLFDGERFCPTRLAIMESARSACATWKDDSGAPRRTTHYIQPIKILIIAPFEHGCVSS